MALISPFSNLFGERETGQDVRVANVMAVQSISNVLKSSLGPQGLDKMLVDDVGDVTITNDGATILKKLETHHPAEKVLVDLSELQDKESGDGTTTVTLIAAELLKRGNDQVKRGVHPTTIISGYKLAAREALKYLKENLVTTANPEDRDLLLNVSKTTLSSKFIGSESNYFSNLVVDAILGVKTVNNIGDVKYPVKAINVLKCHGQSVKESFLYNGYGLSRLTRASVAMPCFIKDAKIAMLDFNLKQHRMQFGVQIQISDAYQLEKIREKEKNIIRDRIQKIIDSGANVILTTQGIDDMSLKYMVEHKIIGVRRVPKSDLHRLAKCTGATICLTMANMEGDEHFDPNWLGKCNEVAEERVGDWDFLFFKDCQTSKALSLVIRGANESFLDEVERSVHDALSAVSETLHCKTLCVGGGAIECALSVYLEEFSKTLSSREQVAVYEFASALLVIPKTLAMNAAADSLNLLAQLRSRHYHYIQKGKLNLIKDDDWESSKWYGLNLNKGSIENNLLAGVLEPGQAKIKAIKFSTEACITIMRIDDVIKLNPTNDDH